MLLQPIAISVALLTLALGLKGQAGWVSPVLLVVAVLLPVLVYVDHRRSTAADQRNPIVMTTDCRDRTLAIACTNPTSTPIDNCRVVLVELEYAYPAAPTNWSRAKVFLASALLPWTDTKAEGRTIAATATAIAGLVEYSFTINFILAIRDWRTAAQRSLGDGYWRAVLQLQAPPRLSLSHEVRFHIAGDRLLLVTPEGEQLCR